MDYITVDFKKFEKIYNIAKSKGLTELSFEFVVASCFPDIMHNIKDEMRRQYTLGYLAGKEEIKPKPDQLLN